MKNKIEDLRNHLFATLEALQDKDDPMDIERARTIAQVGSVIVNSAKVEVDFLKTTGAIGGSGFIPDAPRNPAALPGSNTNPRRPEGGNHG